MHLNLDFTTVKVLWTLTFAALLVLLVVLLGRERTRLYPIFTASMALTAIRLLASRMLYGRLAPLAMSEIFLVLAFLEGLTRLAVVVEIARRAFLAASRRAWIIGTLVLLAGGAAVLAKWGPWPAWKAISMATTMDTLRLVQLAAQKTDLLADVLTVELGAVVVLFGRRFKAGWRSHTQQIAIGLSTASIAQMAVRAIWEVIALHTVPHSQEEYEHAMGLQEKLYNASSAIFVAVLVWWIVCLWINEPGTEVPTAASAGSSPTPPDEAPQEEEKQPGD